ncbi:MAG TPA: universal stress protein [Nocardioides sp.]|nr:universal stress protein [Nocardioides sp.]
MNDPTELLQEPVVPGGTIVVGVDTHDTWQDAADWAADQAVLDGRGVTLVHVADTTEEIWHDPAGHDTRIGLAEAVSAPQQVLEQARTRVVARAPHLAVHTVLRGGGVRDALRTVAQDAHLLVLGARRHRTLWSRLAGTVGAGVVRRPPCPAVVVHPTNPVLVHRGVLAAVDDTARSDAVLRFAFRQASQRGLPLTVLHVAPEPTYGPPADDPEEARYLAEVVAGLREVWPDVPAQTVIGRGDPSAGILDAGRRMNLVVLGAHEGRSLADLLLGSVVSPVVERADCPVAVVPPALG